jgi:hypothetical protein
MHTVRLLETQKSAPRLRHRGKYSAEFKEKPKIPH